MAAIARVIRSASLPLLLLASGANSAQELYQYRDESGAVRYARERKMDSGYLLFAKEGWSRVELADGVSVWVQDKSITRQGKLRKAWFLWNYSNTQKTTGMTQKEYSHALRLSFFDCSERTTAVAQVLFYSGTENVHAYNEDADKLKLTDVAPDTIGESTLEFVCRAKIAAAPDSSKSNSAAKSPSPK